MLPAEPFPPAEDDSAPAYPTVVQQAKNNMNKFEDCVVLTRVGNFYELYFEHAEKYGPPLALKVSKKKTNAGPVAMAGFQIFQLDRYLKILVEDLRKHVAISEEFANTASGKIKSGGLMFDRRVTRIVTPGTLIDEKFLDPLENNFLLAVHVPDGVNQSKQAESSNDHLSRHIGVAWADLSSGAFFTQTTTAGSLATVVARVRPREVLVENSTDLFMQKIFRDLRLEGNTLSYRSPIDAPKTINDWTPMLEKPLPTSMAKKFTAEEQGAGGALLDYVRTQIQGLNLKMQAPTRTNIDDFMVIDKNTLRGLELRSTLRDGLLKGSLLHATRKTVTESGARLLNERLVAPSLSLREIEDRLDLVEEILNNAEIRDRLVALLKRTQDTLRLVQKFSLGRGNADDLLALAGTIVLTADIKELLSSHIKNCLLEQKHIQTTHALQSLAVRFKLTEARKLADRILDAIDEAGLTEQHRREDNEAAELIGLAENVMGSDIEQLRGFKTAAARRSNSGNGGKETEDDDGEIWIMRRNASETLTKLHDDLNELLSEKTNLAVQLRDRLNASSLTLRWTPALGHICHVKGKDAKFFNHFDTGTRVLSSSRSTASIQLREWKDLGSRIDEAKLQIRAEEQRVLRGMREEVIYNLFELRANAAVLDELDVSCSFATLAAEQRWIRPRLNTGTTHRVVGGRHPMVESGLVEAGRSFTSNDCAVGAQELIWLITGPNMAGKSTFLRQNAIISILAQTGSFVPAEYAEIGLVDRIFSRIGSADNLSQDQSTFMVEMLETAEILRNATSRSFVIMDEVGRGTTPQDGVAVGFACLYHLYHVNQSRTLFATHFHDLADMTAEWERLARYCNDVVEDEQGKFAYVHRLKRGVNRQSHALKVARLAGLPEGAIAVAAAVLEGKGVATERGASSVAAQAGPAS